MIKKRRRRGEPLADPSAERRRQSGLASQRRYRDADRARYHYQEHVKQCRRYALGPPLSRLLFQELKLERCGGDGDGCEFCTAPLPTPRDVFLVRVDRAYGWGEAGANTRRVCRNCRTMLLLLEWRDAHRLAVHITAVASGGGGGDNDAIDDLHRRHSSRGGGGGVPLSYAQMCDKARRRGLTVTLSAAEHATLVNGPGALCAYCRRPGGRHVAALGLDRIRNDDTTYHAGNVVAAHVICNGAKAQRRDIATFLRDMAAAAVTAAVTAAAAAASP